MSCSTAQLTQSAPRLLIVTEAPVAPEAQGASKTLYELFGTYPGAVRVLSSSTGPEDHLDRVRVPRRILPERLNRFGGLVSDGRGSIDRWLLLHGPWIRSAVRGFAPDIVLACPLGEWGIVASECAVRQARAPLITYFMDDWPGVTPGSRASDLLRKAAAWLMISDQLRDGFVERYTLAAPPTMVLHNPARASSEKRRDRATTGKQRPYRVVYGGSIWPMHADAVVLTARAVALLRARGVAIELVVHTSPKFAQEHAGLWTQDGVIDGGLQEPAELQRFLLEADLALVACSFAEEQRLISRSSVQTKLTEYMGAGTPILGVGPTGAASIAFIERWGVGRCCTKPDAAYLADVIDEFLCSDDLLEMSMRARTVVSDHFDAGEVRARLWRFIISASDDPGPAAEAV